MKPLQHKFTDKHLNDESLYENIGFLGLFCTPKPNHLVPNDQIHIRMFLDENLSEN
jgi:hypothetical protein